MKNYAYIPLLVDVAGKRFYLGQQKVFQGIHTGTETGTQEQLRYDTYNQIAQ